jgi:hypothetical protein
MMRASFLSLAAAPLALLAASPSLADHHAVSEAAAPVKGPALWKVADEDTTIYLFGTIHVLPEGIEWYDATIANALTSADMLVTESPKDAASEVQLRRIALIQGVLPHGTTLRSLLTVEQSKTYKSALAKIGLPPAALDRLKPWAAGLTLATVPPMQQGYSRESGVEQVLLGKIGDKPRGALETGDFQLGIFEGMSQESQISFLMEAAEGVDEAKQRIDQRVAEWAAGDIDALAATMKEEMTDPAVAEALLYSRNANWAEWIDARLDEPGTVFIAVGAGHLVGARSVQDYLVQKGIGTDRVK